MRIPSLPPYNQHIALGFIVFLATAQTIAAKAARAVDTCYFPDLEQKQDKRWAANGTTSGCCNVANDNFLPNGLCQVKADGSFYRGTCALSTWPEKKCLKICAGDGKPRQQSNDFPVQSCDGTPSSLVWCCGTDPSCCRDDIDGDRSTIAATLGNPIPTLTGSLAFTYTLDLATATTNRPKNSNPGKVSGVVDAATSSGLSAGAKAGIGVGVVVGVITLVTGVLFVVRGRRRGRAVACTGETGDSDHTLVMQDRNQSAPRYEGSAAPYFINKPAQLDGAENTVHELPAGGRADGPAVPELPGTTVRV